jgi:hypothetical protein
MNNNSETTTQARGCVQLGDLLIFAFGSFIMFAKTANLLGKFAPDDWFGFAPSDYGIAAALLIEGFLVWRKVKMWLLPPKNFVEWATDLVTTFVPFALSLVAQAIDGYITTGIIQTMSQEQKTTITTVVSLLIGVPILLDIGKTAIENAPPGIFDNLKTNDAVGNPFWWWPFSKKKNTVLSQAEVVQTEIKDLPKSPNGEDEEVVNPTIGKRSR